MISRSDCEYALGYTIAEHERLIRQAELITPTTERLFRQAGIGPGPRVLDLGSGLGDVSMTAAKLVGACGEVVGIERDPGSIAKEKARVDTAGMRHVIFVQGDVNDFVSEERFDAAVGRFVLMFLPDPLSVLRLVSRLVRPGGVLAFQEPSWAGMLAMAARVPLWSRVLQTIHETFLRAGINPEMGIDLHCKFQELGFPAPKMHLDMFLGSDASLTDIMVDLLRSIRPLALQHGAELAELGNFDTLRGRVHSEITTTRACGLCCTDCECLGPQSSLSP